MENSGEDLPSQSRLRAVGLSEGCPGCRHLRTGQGRPRAHSEACRKRIEGLLKGDPVGSARLAAAHERINRALADAKDAAKDPGVRGILKRASATCHPESESQKKIALNAHAPRSRMEDHPHQAHDQAAPQGLHRTPTRVT